jgi:hypothetical protein
MLRRNGLMTILILLLTMLAACSDGDSITSGLMSSDSDSEFVDVETDTSMDEVAADTDQAVENGERSGMSAQIRQMNFDRRVIRNGELDLSVSDVRSAARQARETVADHGGYEASSSARSLSDAEERTDISFEVPAAAFEEIMSELRDGSYVVLVKHESTSSQDVTEEFVDLQSQLTNLNATEARFIELLEDAHTISDVLSVESEITRIRGEIERIQGRLNYLEQRTDYSRIHVSLEEARDDAVAVAGQHFTPGETAREAWNASMEFVGTVGNALIAVVVFFWWGWPLLALGAFVISHYRKRRTEAASE